jgi:hypothetical protein
MAHQDNRLMPAGMGDLMKDVAERCRSAEVGLPFEPRITHPSNAVPHCHHVHRLPATHQQGCHSGSGSVDNIGLA